MSSIKVQHIPKPKRKSKPKSFSDLIYEVPHVLSSANAQYSRMKEIGSGSYGKCFVVINQTTKAQLACKILSCALIQDEVNKDMVKNEIKFHRKLKHEHVVGFVESFIDQRHIYIVQALCANGTLNDIITQRQRIYVSECRYCVHQILKGIDYIHNKGIVHRDLKLANILVDGNMQMKICDFGLAILEKDAHLEADILCGTTNYLAPEVISLLGFEQRSDIWAIGVIAFILLHGNKPFEAEDEKATYDRIARADYRLASSVDPDVKSFFQSVFETNVKNRSNAIECLKLNFFQMHSIPATLSILPHPEKSQSAMDISSSCNQNVAVHKPELQQQNPVEYQPIQVEAQSVHMNSAGYGEHIQVLQAVLQRFCGICGSCTINSDVSFSNFARLPDHEPDYWIIRWSFDDVSANGFAYQLSDHSIGTLFLDGFHFMRTPDKVNWSVSSRGRLQRIGDPRGSFQPYLMKISQFEEILLKNGKYGVATTYDRSKLPHLITWFQTDMAMVMYLSNHTVQINFSQSHKKVVICPHNETITFASNKICRENFKTVTFETLAANGLSSKDFDMLKYITTSIKHLTVLLDN